MLLVLKTTRSPKRSRPQSGQTFSRVSGVKRMLVHATPYSSGLKAARTRTACHLELDLHKENIAVKKSKTSRRRGGV